MNCACSAASPPGSWTVKDKHHAEALLPRLEAGSGPDRTGDAARATNIMARSLGKGQALIGRSRHQGAKRRLQVQAHLDLVLDGSAEFVSAVAVLAASLAASAA